MITLKEIKNIVCEVFDITEPALVGKGRHRYLTQARIIYSYLGREAGYSFPRLGEAINRDHTTIIYHVNEKNDAQFEEFKREHRDVYNKFLGRCEPILSTMLPGNEELVNRVKSKKYKNVFDLYGHACAVEGCCYNAVLEVHHIVPRSKGGGNNLDNLVVLCPNHHSMADRGLLYIKGIIE